MKNTIFKNEKNTFDKIVKEVKENGKQQKILSGYMSESGNLSSNQRIQQRANSYEFINEKGAPILFMENNWVAEFNYTYNKKNDQVSIVYDKVNKKFAYYLHSGSMGHNLLALVSPEESEFPVYSSQNDPYGGLLKLQQKGQISDEEKKSTIRETIQKDLLEHPMFKEEAYEILAGFDQILSIDKERNIQPFSPLEIENIKLKIEIKEMKKNEITQKEENEKLKKELSKLQEENEKLKVENKSQKIQITKLEGMLGKSLEFITKVRDSVVGKLFFKKTLQEFDKDKKTLPEIEER